MAAEFTIRCFGPARHAAGTERLAVSVETPTTPGAPLTVNDVLRTVANDPATPTGLVLLLPHCAIAVDDALVALDQPVADGAELALLPPVAGG